MEESACAANIFRSQSVPNVGRRSSASNVALAQKLFAEAIGAYVIIFAWCGSVAMYKLVDDESITLSGISMTWGAVVMVMVYSMGQVSGAHFNPVVTIIFSIFRRFPWKLAPVYIIAQVIGSVLAGGTLALLLGVDLKAYIKHFPKVG
ncbi:probable aquaporin NIP-type [Lycium ferocissimum]|uniref:probable aquaporin NIP-type n=1 Tax=Lycium ferocissimum TaxID=112874 RepID=UPI002814AFC7|nr:probable aquaporin NIP-type [Lycium ferocissimum]